MRLDDAVYPGFHLVGNYVAVTGCCAEVMRHALFINQHHRFPTFFLWTVLHGGFIPIGFYQCVPCMIGDPFILHWLSELQVHRLHNISENLPSDPNIV